MNFRSSILIYICLIAISCQTNEKQPVNDLIPMPTLAAGFNSFSSLTDLGEITLDINNDFEDEAYKLVVDYNSINITSKDSLGYFLAYSTLQQLLDQNDGRIPQCIIEDSPRFRYRGMHLDVGRHMFSTEEIKRYINFLAYYKFNRFHWHLTEDQGWRIEIKKYPKLQEIAAYRDSTLMGHTSDIPQIFDNNKYGGFYTQNEAKEIVRYAASKGIEVIPEIEMPGHSLAALTAYPELGCNGGPYKVGTSWGVFEDVYCPYESTFEFLEDVIDEIVEIFPSNYIHIGGDESPKSTWKESTFCQQMIKDKNLKDEHGLQSYFITRMEAYINSKGRQIIGWDEILEGGLAPNAAVMSWRGEQGGLDAANQNHNVVMTPTNYCYFDYYQHDGENEPVAIGGYLPVEKVYEWDPIPEKLPREKHKYVIGGQGNVWTEYMPDFENVEYMAFNRMIAMSEVLWTSKALKTDFETFKPRFSTHLSHWKSKGVNIANHLLNINPKVQNNSTEGSYLQYAAEPKIYARHQDQREYTESSKVILDIAGTYYLYASDSVNKGPETAIDFQPHLATKAVMDMETEPSKKYYGNGPRSIINGVKGSNQKYGGNEWLGFDGNDCNFTLTFDKSEVINTIEFRFYNGENQWIYLPSKVEIKSGDSILHSITNFESTKISELSLPLNGIECNSLNIKITNFGAIPEGREGAGHRAWLFVDEVVVR